MKKIISLLLTLIMVFSLATVAFAEEEPPATPKYTDASTITFTKSYEAVGEGAVSPKETFEFENIAFVSATETGVEYTEDWATANLPTISTVDYAEGAAGSENKTGTFTVTLPTNYPSVGIYTYSFNEKDKNVEGVTYNTTTMRLVVTVVEENGLKRVAAVHCEPVAAEGEAQVPKTNTFDNTYSAGKLSVKKLVTGNLGDKTKEFTIKVSFTASVGDTVMSDITYTDTDDNVPKTIEAGTNGWTTKDVEITLNHDETITFANIPAGVTYTVVETDLANKANTGATDTYTATYSGENGTIVAGVTSNAVVTNTKDTDVDTGISLDSAPYFLMLAVAVFGMVALVSKKRYEF